MPDFLVAVRTFAAAKRQDDAAQYGLPQPTRQLDHALIGQKFTQIRFYGGGGGRGGGAEVNQQYAGFFGAGGRFGEEMMGHGVGYIMWGWVVFRQPCILSSFNYTLKLRTC